MKNHSQLIGIQARLIKQRGVVLFFALIALLAMSLAAVALIRSVDTSTMIAGNLSFKQSATSSGDTGIEAAVLWLAALDAANSNINILLDTTHPLNVTGGSNAAIDPLSGLNTGDWRSGGYYSNVNFAVSLTDGTGIQWTNADSTLVIPSPDSSGNTIRYVIQRMCRNGNLAVGAANCLFSGALQDNNGQNIPLPQEVCSGTGCPVAGQTPQIRITSRTTGPKNTVSYVQAFVY